MKLLKLIHAEVSYITINYRFIVVCCKFSRQRVHNFFLILYMWLFMFFWIRNVEYFEIQSIIFYRLFDLINNRSICTFSHKPTICTKTKQKMLVLNKIIVSEKAGEIWYNLILHNFNKRLSDFSASVEQCSTFKSTSQEGSL